MASSPLLDGNRLYMQILDSSTRLVLALDKSNGKEIWKHVSNDLEKMSDLGTLLQNLVAAEKLQLVPGNKGFLPKRKIIEEVDTSMVDYSLLSPEERACIK